MQLNLGRAAHNVPIRVHASYLGAQRAALGGRCRALLREALELRREVSLTDGLYDLLVRSMLVRWSNETQPGA